MKVHFIGIGGIGISGIARIYKQKGWEVSGSDEEQTEITKNLKEAGIKVLIGHKPQNIPTSTILIIYSEAVPKSNPELKQAKVLKIKVLSGAEALGELSKEYFLIAISGMHGKSTTASMVGAILLKAKLDPTFIIGVKNGWRLGKSKYLILEADDYQAKFLNYHPDILILTNIEEEHLDWFKNFQRIKEVFQKYINQVKGHIIVNKDDKNTMEILSLALPPLAIRKKTTTYSLKDKEAILLNNILKVPGKHNVSNALAALKAVRILGINDEVSYKAISEFKGAWRRFEESDLKIKNQKLRVISDYAHHPTEIAATFQALKEKYSKKRIWVVFQPHQYQRTFYLFNRFVEIFQRAKKEFGIEKIIITDIYSVKGRESQSIRKKTNSQKLVKTIEREEVEYFKQNLLEQYIKKNASKIDVLVIMGAGDIYKLKEKLK